MIAHPQTFHTVPRLIEVRAAQSPGSPAVVTGDESLTYEALLAQARRVAAALVARGIGPGSHVAVCVNRDAHLVPSLLGVLWSGAAYVPIDPSFPQQRIRQMLDDALPRAVVASRVYASIFDGFIAEVLPVEELPDATGTLAPAADPAGLAYVIYTSGSTGRPKGVMVEHAGLTNVLQSVGEMIGAGPSDSLLAVTTVSFDIAGLELFLPLLTGGTVVMATRDEAIDGRVLARLLDERRISIMQATPATWRMLVDVGWAGRRGLRGLVGGEALPRPLADALLSRVGKLWNVYGPTETSVWSTAHEVRPGAGPVPIGRALANTTLHVLDAERRPAREGELFIGGAGVARGYLKRPDLTEARFIADPFSPGGRLYRTGDLCRWRDDGDLEFIGRADHQVKIRGYRVELGDVEAALAADPDAAEVVAGARDDGSGTPALVAYVCPKPGCKPTLADIRRRASERLPVYMLPTGLVLVERMPRTPAGKTDRAALAAIAVAPAASDEPVVPEAKDDLELVVVTVFREILGRSDLGPLDDFFDAGGHSLLAFRAAQEIHRRTGQTVDVTLLFQHPTANGLASILRSRGGMSVVATAIDLQPRGSRPPLICVCGVAIYLPLARALAPDQPVTAMYVDADLDAFHSDRNGSARLPTVEELAERYLREIRERRPAGPYRFLGFSMGGAVAYEVACRLIEAGQRVDLVAMIDTILADSIRRRPIRLARHVVRRTLADGPSWAVQRAAESLAGPRDAPGETADENNGEVDRRFIEARGREILAAYRPRPCDVDVLLFNAADRPRMDHIKYDETGGWRAMVGDRLTVEMVPGDHLDVISTPERAQRLADALRSKLAGVDGPGSQRAEPTPQRAT